MCANKKPCTTILEEARRAEKAIGLVTTSSITHATPAAFIAHVDDRAQMEDIAAFFLKTPPPIFLLAGA